MDTSKKACRRLGIHPNTLRKWADAGKIKHIRTPHNQRLYDVDDFLAGHGQRSRIVYCRVSSRNQLPDLKSQVEFVKGRYPEHEIIEDIGSGHLSFALFEGKEVVVSGDNAKLIVKIMKACGVDADVVAS